MESQERKGDLKGSPFSSIVARINEANSKPDRRRELGLIEEVRIGFRFVKHGLHEVDRIVPGNDFYHPPVQFLAMGFERILKCMICMHFRESNGSYPTKDSKLWPNSKRGHDLVFLKQKVTAFCIPLKGASKEDDYAVLTNDKRVNALLRLLSEYGIGSRYYNLNALLLSDPSSDPMREYDRLTGDLAHAIHGDELLEEISNPHTVEEAYRTMNREIKALVERYIRALARQFIFGSFQNQSRRFLSDLDPFYKLADKDLGVRCY